MNARPSPAPAPASPGAAPAPPPLSDREFKLLQELVYREAGIYLAPHKKALLVSRLSRRLRELGLARFSDYYELVADAGGEEERSRMLECLCTHETRFFREPRQFDFLERVLIPGWAAEAAAGRRPRRVRVWSAGCSSGEEPFSAAMCLLHQLSPVEGWCLEVLATDLSSRVLERAREATWPVRRAGEIPAHLLKRFMLRGTRSQEGNMRAGEEVRAIVHFQRSNLNDPAGVPRGPFDLILCRNVLIYFDTASRSGVVRRLLGQLAPGGHLFLGHAESLLGLGLGVRSVLPTVYRVDEDGARRERRAS